MSRRRGGWELWIVVVAAGVGIVDAVIGGAPDLAAVFGAILVLTLLALARARTERRRVGLRADVVAWLEDTADLEATTVESVADRRLAVARGDSLDRVGTRPAARP